MHADSSGGKRESKSKQNTAERIYRLAYGVGLVLGDCEDSCPDQELKVL